MKQQSYFFIIIAIVGIVFISGCVKEFAPGTTQVVDCNWVFKTNADYSNLISVSLNLEKNKITSWPFFSEITKLDNGYYTGVWGCKYPDQWVIAFTSLTLDELKQAQEDCDRQIEEKYGIREKEHPEAEERGSVSCEFDFNPTLDDVIDDNPFTELYFCRGEVDELNPIINNAELDSKCEKIA